MKTKINIIKPSRELIKAVELVLICQAWEETVKPIVKKYTREILQKNTFFVSDEMLKIQENRNLERLKDNIIRHEKHAYMMNGNDAEEFYKKIHEEHIKAGFYPILKKYENHERGIVGFCPLCIAESDTREAKRKMLKLAEPITKINIDKVIFDSNLFKKLEDLTINYVINFIDTDKLKNNFQTLDNVKPLN